MPSFTQKSYRVCSYLHCVYIYRAAGVFSQTAVSCNSTRPLINISMRLKKINTYNPRLLTLFIWVLSLAGIILWIFLIYYILAIFKMPEENQNKALAWGVNISRRLAFLTISVSSLYVLIRAQHTRATLYFALFFSFLSLGVSLSWLITVQILSEDLRHVVNIAGGICIILLVRFIQEFPGQVNQEQIKQVYTGFLTRKLLAPILVWLLKPFRVWIVLLPLALLIPSWYGFGFMLILLTSGLSLGYLYIQLKVSKSALKNRLYWLLWMLIVIFFSTVYSMLLTLFGSTISIIDKYYLPMLENLSILFAFIMIVYFSDLIDAKLILRKTVVFGAIIFLFTFIFGIAEHFIIHQLSHYLHLNDVYIASTFACVIGMFFHPIKEKLTHWMKHFDKTYERGKEP